MCFNFNLIILSLTLFTKHSNQRTIDNTIGLSVANNHFSLRLLQHLFDGQKNIFLSPFSISTALGVVYNGANGNTAQELENVLGYKFANISRKQMNEQFLEVFDEINNKSDKKYELMIANKIIVAKRFKILKSFAIIAEKYFKSNIESKDLRFNAYEVMNELNEWVAKQTNNKIDEILSIPLKPGDAMVILNAIYFKGVFQTQFNVKETREDIFFNNDETEAEVKMMRRVGAFNYTEIPKLKSKLLEIPYSGEDISLYVVLPKNRQGIQTLIESLKDFNAIEKSISTLRLSEVVVIIPKFKLKTEYNLSENLFQMGIKSVFTKASDLSAISHKNHLFVSQVKHKAMIEVSEEGTEATAVSAVVISLRSSDQPRQLVFKANHPFLYFIRDNRNGMILFSGVLNSIGDTIN